MMLSTFKNFFRNSMAVRIFGYEYTLKINRVKINKKTNKSCNPWSDFQLKQALFLISKYPFLQELKLTLNEATAENILDLFFEIIPVIDLQAKEVIIRNALYKMQCKTESITLQNEAILEIARSDLRSGIPDRALVLKDDESLKGELELQMRQSDQAYGAQLLGSTWHGVSRGRTLCYYFENHRNLLRGKKILHFSPETELREWMVNNASELSLTYKTSNILGRDVDLNQDITALTIEDSYDIVICHRVLEHVLDDRKALAELFRILRPNGFLQISVPQSMHKAHTLEWTVPDMTHHQHVRHYGSDFSHRLREVGFTVEEDQWLLQQSHDQLASRGSYPLKMYTAYKSLAFKE